MYSLFGFFGWLKISAEVLIIKWVLDIYVKSTLLGIF